MSGEQPGSTTPTGTSAFFPLIIPYLFVAVRRVYGVGRTYAALSVVALLFVQMAATQVYRLLLFWISFANV